MSPLDEKTLGQALRREAHRPELTTFDLADIQGAARGIRRRRRVAGGLAAALAIGVLVPGALLLTPGGDRVDDPVERPTSEPAEVEYGQEATLDLREAGGGGTTTVPYLVDGAEVVVGGTRFPDPGATQSLVPLGDGWLATGIEGGEEYGYVLDDDGSVTDEFPSGPAAHDPATGRTAYVVRGEGRDDQDLVVADADGATAWQVTLPLDTVLQPAGFVDDDVVVRRPGTGDGPETLQRVAADGSVTDLARIRGVQDVHAGAGVVSAQTRTNDDGSGCFAVLELDGGGTVWETCEHGLRGFSPDGRFVSAGPAYRSGIGDPSVTVLDARTGEVVVDFRPPRGPQVAAITQEWEDGDSLVVSVQQSDSETEPARHSILRLDLDGTLETVTETLPYDDAADFRHLLL